MLLHAQSGEEPDQGWVGLSRTVPKWHMPISTCVGQEEPIVQMKRPYSPGRTEYPPS